MTGWPRAATRVAIAVLASCGGPEPENSCSPAGDELYEDLSQFCMVDLRDGEIAPRSAAVVPYDLAAPGFSDYATKRRTVWVPPGTKATVRDDVIVELPTGSVITKSFGFPRDGTVRWVETRVLVRRVTGWEGAAYVWSDDQSAARKQPGGTIRELDVRGTDGAVQHASYLVPSQQQCPKCHGSDGAIVPIGIGAGARLPAWDDPVARTDVRARAYLASNCAFCHSPKGEARTTGLYLTFEETDPTRLGRCKSPIAAGAATADLRFDVVPGEPDASILLRRMIATEPSIAMPEIGRSVVHTEGVKLVRDWIAGMSGDCSSSK